MGVAGQDRRADTEDRPRGRAVPPLGIPVHDVVVQQGEVVHQLNRDRGADPALRDHAGLFATRMNHVSRSAGVSRTFLANRECSTLVFPLQANNAHLRRPERYIQIGGVFLAATVFPVLQTKCS